MWTPAGERPTALGHHRYQWLHVSAFVQPILGARSLCPPDRGRPRAHIVLDNAGWHGPKSLAVPDGITLVFLPPYSPELQPAKRLWPLVDEPVANRHFATLDALDATVAERCRRLDPATLRPHTSSHWWPKPVLPN